LLLIAFSFFRPGFWMDMLISPFTERAPTELVQAIGEVPSGESMRLRVKGVNDVGDPIEFVAVLPIADGGSAEEKLNNSGLKIADVDGKVMVEDVTFDSLAQAAGLDWDQEIVDVLQPASQPSKYWIYLPALILLALIVLIQRRRTAQPVASPRVTSEAHS
jgi:hypothetical protein